jgi:hypothetical protein
VTAKPPNPDPVESVRRILNMPAPSLQDLEAAAAALDHVRGDLDVEIAGMAARRRELLAADGPAHEIDRQLEKHDETVHALTRRGEVAAAIATKLAARMMAAREAAAEEKRQAAYAAARALRDATAKRVKQFCDRVAPEAAEVLQAYAAAEAATAAVNRDLPAGLPRIQSIEHERQGSPLPARVTERRVPWFVHNGIRIAEVGKVEAFPHQNGNGLWTIYRRSNAVQGDETIGPCVIVEYIEEAIRKPVHRPLEALSSSLRIPSFDAPAPDLGRAEIRLTLASPVPALAAE